MCLHWDGRLSNEVGWICAFAFGLYKLGTFKVPWAFPSSDFFGDLMASDNGLQFESAEFICVCFDVVGFDT